MKNKDTIQQNGSSSSDKLLIKSKDRKRDFSEGWRLVNHIRRPINFFAFGIMVCGVTFATASIQAMKYDSNSFKYAIHMFLGVVGMFFLVAIYCPRSLYGPDESESIKDLEHSPKKVVLWSAIFFVLYLVYHGIMHFIDGVKN